MKETQDLILAVAILTVINVTATGLFTLVLSFQVYSLKKRIDQIAKHFKLPEEG